MWSEIPRHNRGIVAAWCAGRRGVAGPPARRGRCGKAGLLADGCRIGAVDKTGLIVADRTRIGARCCLAGQRLRNQCFSNLGMNDRKHRIVIPENGPQRLVLRVQIRLRTTAWIDPRLKTLLRDAGRIGALSRTKAGDAISKRRHGIADRRVSPALKAGAQAVAKISGWL